MLWMRERRLAGLVAGAVEADHEAVTHELVGTHALHRRQILDALGLRGRGGDQEQRGAISGEQFEIRRMGSPVGSACSERRMGRIEEAEQPAGLGGVGHRALPAVGDVGIGHAPRQHAVVRRDVARTHDALHAHELTPGVDRDPFLAAHQQVAVGEALGDGDGDGAVECIALRCSRRCRRSPTGCPSQPSRTGTPLTVTGRPETVGPASSAVADLLAVVRRGLLGAGALFEPDGERVADIARGDVFHSVTSVPCA